MSIVLVIESFYIFNFLSDTAGRICFKFCLNQDATPIFHGIVGNCKRFLANS